jgi:uncharacterized protein YfiM (DUF2279 family)
MKEDLGRLTARESRKAWKKQNQYRHGKGKTPAGSRIGRKGGKKAKARRAERRAKIGPAVKHLENSRLLLCAAIQEGNAENIANSEKALGLSQNVLSGARREFAQSREARLALAQKGLRAEVA